MKQSIIEQLREISRQERTILQSDSPVLSHFAAEPDLVTEETEEIPAPANMVTVLKHPRFVPFPFHIHSYLEMSYIVTGTLRHIISPDTELTLEAGDLLFLQPGTRHSTAEASYGDLAVHFLISPEFLRFPCEMLIEDTMFRRFMTDTINGTRSQEPFLLFHLQNMTKAQNLLENLILTLSENQRNRQRVLKITTAALMLELTQLTYKVTVGNPSSYEQELVLKALSYIENHYRTASLEDFCRNVNRPTYYISRLMKRYSPYTFTQYVQRRRLVQAVYLLTETDIPIEDIITDVGYENSSHFYRLFKQTYHMSPREYRKNYLNKL